MKGKIMDKLQKIAKALDFIIIKIGSKYRVKRTYYSSGYECDNLDQVAEVLAEKVKRKIERLLALQERV